MSTPQLLRNLFEPQLAHDHDPLLKLYQVPVCVLPSVQVAHAR
jgi:hypothetical protein